MFKKKLNKTNLLGYIVASLFLLLLYSCCMARYEFILKAGNGFAVTDWPVT